jgi:hypothetical protein
MDTLADRIRSRLAELGKKPADLVSAGVLSKAGVYNVLNGDVRAETIRNATLVKFARALDVTPAWLATGRGPKLLDDADPQSLQGVIDSSEGADSSGDAVALAPRASHSAQLDDDKLERSIQFLERQFALLEREFVASRNADLIAGVYARIGRRGESNLIALSQWLNQQLEDEGRSHVGTGGIRSAG